MKIKGEVEIVAFRVDDPRDFYEFLKNPGKLIYRYKSSNVITLLGRKRVAELISGASTAEITQLAIGDAGTPVASPTIPLIPTVNDVALAHEVTRDTAASRSLIGDQKAEFTAGFVTNDLVDGDFLDPLNKVINEAGLLTSDNVLFARRTFPSIAFGPADRVGTLIRWIIEIL